jgi:uncharacterized membrane protein YgcG
LHFLAVFSSVVCKPIMRKSRDVQLTILAAIALSMTACHDERRDCVDAQNRLQPESVCQAGTPGGHYIYGGSSGGHTGDSVVGGGVSRGGFGGTGGGDGGAGGE